MSDASDPRARWARVTDLFHRALALPPDGREAFLDDACGSDAALRDEIASLLAAHDRAGDFIEAPAVSADAIVAIASGDALPHDGRLGAYRLIRVLGEGGMGVVYLAEDTRLGRTVALKAVAPRLTGDERQRERLRREARAAASLSHPGIAVVYALEEIGGQLYLATEYVPGETLRDELARGPLPVAAVVATGLLLARALAAAHDRGIVHRDLKPENVIRTPSGDLKILDFGLARARGGESGDARLTAPGAVLGTPAYMAPEQIRGAPVDGRADLFSLGVVLYELATGTNPFASVDASASIARVLEIDPPALAARLPREDAAVVLDRVVAGCLQKDPAARFPSAHAVAGALSGVATATPRSSSDAPVASPSSARWWWAFHQAIAGAADAALLVPLWFVHRWTPGRASLILFLAAVSAAIAVIALRSHRWFAAGAYPDDWREHQPRTSRWLLVAECAFILSLVSAGALLLLRDTHAEWAVVCVASAVAIFVSVTIIEPATTRAAFR